ncbi:hypothetical protein GUJ93_ZPchr0003g16477 [Zizania palustris]|uniref:Uncharacterized protein n=1 Tax=Zizania palustris TaxID=103762 RepID=A0A8J5S898_ZIZPA|nr:hypothetical protein GUJ93_ZPchr0003g16477 [Zizania palustris]
MPFPGPAEVETSMGMSISRLAANHSWVALPICLGNQEMLVWQTYLDSFDVRKPLPKKNANFQSLDKETILLEHVEQKRLTVGKRSVEFDQDLQQGCQFSHNLINAV